MHAILSPKLMTTQVQLSDDNSPFASSEQLCRVEVGTFTYNFNDKRAWYSVFGERANLSSLLGKWSRQTSFWIHGKDAYPNPSNNPDFHHSSFTSREQTKIE